MFNFFRAEMVGCYEIYGGEHLFWSVMRTSIKVELETMFDVGEKQGKIKWKH